MDSLSQQNQLRLGGWAGATDRLFRSWRAVWLALLCIHAIAVSGQAQTLRESLGHPLPGAIGHPQLLRGEPLREYYPQPVRLIAPDGAIIEPYGDKTYDSRPETGVHGELTVRLVVGEVVRFRLSELEGLGIAELFPSVEVIDRLYPPQGLEDEFPISIELPVEDLRFASQGRYVTRVIYIEDPDDTFPYDERELDEKARRERDDDTSQRYFEVPSGEDPYVVASGLGRPVAILRIGNRMPTIDEEHHDFALDTFTQLRNSRRMARAEPNRGARSHAMTHRRVTHHGPIATEREADRRGGPATSDLPHRRAKKRIMLASRTTGDAAVIESPVAESTERLDIPDPLEPPAVEIPSNQTLVSPSEAVPGVSRPIVEVITDGEPIVPIIESPRRLRASRFERLRDGGDRHPKAQVRKDWSVRGLDTEDTIAHYDTLAGRTEVSASNQVDVYSPRFAAVRKTTTVFESESVNPAGRVRMMSAPNMSGANEFVDTVKFDGAAVEFIRDRPAQTVEDRAPGRTVEQVDVPTPALGHRPPFVDTQVTQTDEMFIDRLPLEDTYAQKLVIENEIRTVQIVMENIRPTLASKTTGANEFFEYELPDGKARLRVLKIASTTSAHAGDTVRFTIRFDNVGDEAIGNVTVLDNLTTRFAFIPDSQTCDVEAFFTTAPNDQQSEILRWEISEPLEPGQGGTIRFECRVR